MLIKNHTSVTTTNSESQKHENDGGHVFNQHGPEVKCVPMTIIMSIKAWERLVTTVPAADSFIETRSSSAGSFSSACSSENLLDVDYDPHNRIQPLDEMAVVDGHIKGYIIVEGLSLMDNDVLVLRSSSVAPASKQEPERDDGESATSYEDKDNMGCIYGFPSNWIAPGTFAVVGIAGMILAFVLGEMLGEQRATLALAPESIHPRRSTCPFEMERQLGFW